jgi:two-component system, OmpR family, sensor histidine kinase SenX3
MDAAAIASGVGVGLIFGVFVGRWTLRRDVQRLDAEVRKDTAGLEELARASAEASQIQDQILGSMQDGVLLFDGGWHTVFANLALEHHLGARPQTLTQVYPPSLRETIRRVAETGDVEVGEIETGAPTRWLRVTATPAGADGSVLVVIADVTEARSLDAVRRDFVANASHELKTPAASIQAAAETLLHVWQEDPAAVPRFAEQLEREAVRLSRIVADLLDLSRLESGSELQENVRLDALVREETSRFEDAAIEAGLTIDIDVALVPPVRGSGRDLSLLVRNLLDNAIRYTKADGRIIAAVAADNGSVVLRVSDTGSGIPSKDLTRVFERFYRVDRARSRETGGTGLGLAIVRHVAENHGGTVSVTSELGRGSTFEVRLPTANPAENGHAAP